MPSTFTTGIALEKQATGEGSNLWGTQLNAVFDQIDRALAIRLSLSVAGASDITLTTSQAENRSLEFTGILTGNISVIFPTIPKTWIVKNTTAGAFTLTCKVAGQTGVAIPQGEGGIIEGNATDIVLVALNRTVLDSNLNELLKFTKFASAVNEITIQNAATGNAPQIQATGSDTNIDLNLVPKGSGQIDVGTGGATQTEMETGTATDKIVTPGRQKFHPSAAKGWAMFDTTGNVPAGLNVTSVTDNGPGDWSVNWAVDFSSANYCALATAMADSAGTTATMFNAQVNNTSHAAGVTRIQVAIVSTGAVTDPNNVFCAVFGDQ